MTEVETMIQTEIVFDGSSYLLAQDQDVDDLRDRIEAATKTTGTFVHMVVVGNRTVSVLITPSTQVTISTAAVPYDPRDTGDVDFPFSGFYDAL